MQLSDPLGGEVTSYLGYRLQRLELFNWGTFDGEVFSVRLNGQTTLLVGQNGSGKSTLVDALLTLLVRPGVRNFNVAAGAKKTERDERSYLKGAYDRSADEEGSGIQVKFLRPKGEPYSAILACFQNAETGRTFTTAQLLYLGSDQSVEKVHCFSEDDRSIRHDFGGLESTEGLVKVLQQRGWRATKKFSEYEVWLSRTIRAKPKAMEVFNQTVAVKDIQRLNDFIRNHMLESHSWGEKVDNLLGHFVQLIEAHQSLVRVRQQLEHLEPVARHAERYQQDAKELERSERVLEATDAFFAQRTIEILTPEIEVLGDELKSVRVGKETLAKEIEKVEEQRRRLQNEIDQEGGQRLHEIPLLIEMERTYAAQKRSDHARFHDALRCAGIAQSVGDQHQFAEVRHQLRALRSELADGLRVAEEKREALVLERGEVRRVVANDRRELDGLNQRRENLPEWCAALRRALCHELGLPAKDLPFAAELIAVHPHEREWLPSIEKVLRGFALSLLVPVRFYQLVSSYVDRTRLADDRGLGQRLVYVRVGEPSLAAAGTAPGPDSLLLKLEFREGHTLLPWVKTELQQRFDYRCCNSIEEFQACRGLALTRARHAKTGDKRHDKDDRDQAIDPRHFVLGWDNREKKQRLAAAIERLVRRETEIQQKFDELDRDLGWLRKQLSAIDVANSISSFSDVDFEHHNREIAALELEQRAIEDRSDAIKVLKQRLVTAEERQKALQGKRDGAVAKEREIENDIDQAQTLISNAQAELRRSEAEGTLPLHREYFVDLAGRFAETRLTADDLFREKDAFRTGQQALVSRLRRGIEPVKTQLVEAMSRFMRSFPEEHDLRASVEYLDSFLGLRHRIAEEDLPRHERRFKERLNEKVIQEIGLFRGELERERREIQDKVETLNVSLRRLEYRPGTHIQLEPRAVRDPEIIEFQTKLRECIEGSFEDSPEGNEARFLRIQELLQRLQDENNRRWREKITDVRRWFDFLAAVIDRHSGKTVSIYQDSSGQSGGEKAKLAFTILVAAIAYQYDLNPEHPARDRFHFVVVDEMFSKVDDQYAEYALELFRQFGLQLLIVAPLDAKARVTQPYVGCYLHVNKREQRSEIFEMTAREFEESVALDQSRGDTPASGFAVA